MELRRGHRMKNFEKMTSNKMQFMTSNSMKRYVAQMNSSEFTIELRGHDFRSIRFAIRSRATDQEFEAEFYSEDKKMWLNNEEEPSSQLEEFMTSCSMFLLSHVN